jgi:hypothetical protein
MAAVVQAALEHGWKLKMTALLLIASLLPFGPFAALKRGLTCNSTKRSARPANGSLFVITRSAPVFRDVRLADVRETGDVFGDRRCLGTLGI